MLAFLFIALFSGSVFAESKGDHNGLNELLATWKTDCAAGWCLLQTEVLRGDSGIPADSKDFREYVGVNVALARKTGQPEYIAFYADPRHEHEPGSPGPDASARGRRFQVLRRHGTG